MRELTKDEAAKLDFEPSIALRMSLAEAEAALACLKAGGVAEVSAIVDGRFERTWALRPNEKTIKDFEAAIRVAKAASR